MRPGRPADGFLLALFVFLIYALLGQETLYKTDGRHLLRFVLGGSLAHPHHFFYLPLLDLAVRIGDGLGLSPHRSGVLLSAAGMATGVGLVHTSARWLGLSGLRSVLAALLVASTPAVLFFATVVELHGPFFAWAGATTAAAAWWTKRPTMAAAALLGLFTGLSVGAHSTGHLLLIWLLPWASMFVGDNMHRAALHRLWALSILVHGIVSLLLPDLMALFSIHVHRGGDLAAFSQLASANLAAPTGWLLTWWWEWLLPFAPLSVLWLVTVRHHLGRWVACMPGLVAAVTATFLLLGTDRERGAYLLPLAIPAAIAIAAWPGRVRYATAGILLGGLLGVSQVVSHDDPRDTRAFAAGYRSLADGRPTLLLVGSIPDLNACLLHLHDVGAKDLFEEAGLDPEHLTVGLPILLDWLRTRMEPPGQVLITNGAVAYLRQPLYSRDVRSGPVLLAGLTEAFLFEPVAVDGFEGYRLLPR